MARNGFCFLVDTLPKNLKINGHTVGLDTRTSTALSVILYLNGDHTPLEKAHYTVRLLVDFKDQTLREVLDYLEVTENRLAEALIKYLHGAPEVKSWRQLHAECEKTPDNGVSDNKTHKLPSFDFVQDSDAIISAFRQVYHMTLEEMRSLHWWEFLALFNNLPESTTFSTIQKIRTMKIDPKDSPERKKEIKDAKRSVQIIDTRSPEQKRADLQAQFNNLDL